MELSAASDSPAGARLHRFAECRQLDAASMAAGLPEQQLMGQAALASFYKLHELDRYRRAGRVLILCGSGNNGGDGYALAALLAGPGQQPQSVAVYASAPPKSAAAQFYCAQARAAGVPMASATEFCELDLRADDLVIEALLGIGQVDAPRGTIAELLAHLAGAGNAAPYIISLDVPAGLREGDGSALPLVPDRVHSYGVDKLALRLHRKLAARTQIQVLPMGFAPQAYQEIHPAVPNPVQRLVPDELPALRERYNKSPLDHKYSAGHGLLIGGSHGMSGALLMAAQAFFASGGGILHVLTPDDAVRRELQALIPGAMFLDPGAAPPATLRPAAICAGPGLAPEDLPKIAAWLRPIFASLGERYANGRALPRVILDAGALPLAQPDAAELFAALPRAQLLLTPHTGEWQRLGGAAVHCVAEFEQARTFAAQTLRAACLIKDAVCFYLPGSSEPQNMAGVRDRPNAGLAVAGSGDNLCGILLAGAARRTPPLADGPTRTDRFWLETSSAALSLLDRAASSGHHLRADQFAEQIRLILSPQRV